MLLIGSPNSKPLLLFSWNSKFGIVADPFQPQFTAEAIKKHTVDCWFVLDVRTKGSSIRPCFINIASCCI